MPTYIIRTVAKPSPSAYSSTSESCDSTECGSTSREITKNTGGKLFTPSTASSAGNQRSFHSKIDCLSINNTSTACGCAIWGSQGTYIDNLQRLQNQALRTIARAPRFTPPGRILHEELEWSYSYHSQLNCHPTSIQPFPTTTMRRSTRKNHFRTLPLPIVCLTPHLPHFQLLVKRILQL
ncbi:hypothetical protein TNCV_111171 [Trichonephila clavipes]|nr:hypothetical protein TNCV_111171 [Trichonephila clavipes]